MRADEALRVLGVSASATPAEIKAAFRRHVKAWHPDRHGNDERQRLRAEEALRRVLDAYRCLRNGVPPLDAPSAPRAEGRTPESMFTVRPSGPSRAEPPRPPSYLNRARSAPRRRWVGVAWSIFAPVIDWVAASAWLASRHEPVVQVLRATPPTAALASSSDTLVRILATRVGDGWQIRNETNRPWFRCTAWVGEKWINVEELEQNPTVVLLRAADFSPTLGDLDGMPVLFCR